MQGKWGSPEEGPLVHLGLTLPLQLNFENLLFSDLNILQSTVLFLTEKDVVKEE